MTEDIEEQRWMAMKGSNGTYEIVVHGDPGPPPLFVAEHGTWDQTVLASHAPELLDALYWAIVGVERMQEGKPVDTEHFVGYLRKVASSADPEVEEE